MLNATTRISRNKTLTFSLVHISSISEAQLQQMFNLLKSHYDRVTYPQFIKDISWKQLAGFLSDDNGTLRGFTTFAINPLDLSGRSYNIVFSGDTIIERKYWGTQELVRGFVTSVGRIYSGLGEKTLYWFLISKGHRTYLYLPYFFKQYYPAVDSDRGQGLGEITSFLAEQMFGKRWDSVSELVRYPENYCLKPLLSEASLRRVNNKHVKYFLQRNPNFAQGDELVCLAEIHPDNFLRSCKDLLYEGMQDPLDLSTENEKLYDTSRRVSVTAG